MKFRFHLLSGLMVLGPLTGAFAVTDASSPPPGPVQTSESTNAQPSTPAPPQPQTKSAAGGQAANGTNGTTVNGKAVTKGPGTAPAGQPGAAPAPSTASNAPAAAPKPPTVLDNYLKELGDTLKLSDDQKKDVQNYYQADGVLLNNILNNDSVSPLQQAQQVSDLRDKRNEKIVAMLQDPDRQHEYFKIEDRYRVALTELAADGGLIPAQPAAPAPAPSAALPGQTEPVPTTNRGNAQ